MRRLAPFVIVLAVSLAGCGDDEGGGGDESFPEPETSSVPAGGDLPEHVVVFTPDQSEIDPNGQTTTWTPAVDDVLVVEEALADHIAANPDTGVDDLEDYARQYVGVGDDEDLVSVNALCAYDDLDDWEDELIVVADGGDCFWQATVDPQTGTVQSFTVNGFA